MLTEWLYDDVITFDTSQFHLLKTADFHWYSRKRNGQIDGLTNRQTERLSYRDAMRYKVRLIYLLGCLFARKYGFPSFLMKAWPTHGPTDGRTDRPGYRDARTHLKTGYWQPLLQRCENASEKKQGQQTKVACAQLIQILSKIKYLVRKQGQQTKVACVQLIPILPKVK